MRGSVRRSKRSTRERVGTFLSQAFDSAQFSPPLSVPPLRALPPSGVPSSALTQASSVVPSLAVSPVLFSVLSPLRPPLRPLSPVQRPSSPPPLLGTLVSSATNAGTSFFQNARGVILNNPTFSVQGDRDAVAAAIKELSECVIDGAQYDSSARDPPPLCHPSTRVHLRTKIVTWFEDNLREKAFLWLNGPAGVGKSAVIQTFAESLAPSNRLGATLFFSRLHDRKDPQRVFTTVASQLATRIPAYRAYVADRVTLDPSVLKKGMKEQFRIFIAEPFGNRGIGRGEGPWAILLDGLDECEGVDQQCQIIQLVSEFVLSFPYAPLVWAISSRPEPYITATFTDGAVAPSHWSEYVPIDSTEACRDVEVYLDSSFKAMQKRFPHVPPSWPNDAQFLTLTNGASGLFIFARTAIRFVEDPDHADPVSQLNLLLSVINHLDLTVTEEHPLALLDALYTQILASIPAKVWQATKRILGFVVCTRSTSSTGLSYPLSSDSRSLTGVSIILGLNQGAVYGALHKLHSVLEVPHQEDAHETGISFLHASFADYLTDPNRSKKFFIDLGESVDDVTHSLYRLYLTKPWETRWEQYASQLPKILGSRFYQQLEKDAGECLYNTVTGKIKTDRGGGPFRTQQDRSDCLDALSQINTAELYWLDHQTRRFITWSFSLWDNFRGELEAGGIFKEIQLRELMVDHLDCRRNRPVLTVHTHGTRYLMERFHPDSSRVLAKFSAELQSFQANNPEERVLVCGSTPERRNAFIYHTNSGEGGVSKVQYYCIPYPY